MPEGADPLLPPDPDVEPVERIQFGQRLREAALQAEYHTGGREATEAKARAHVVTRMARMSGGTVLLFVGAALLALPGPGWLVIALGLGLLSKDVAWAERTLDRVRRRLPSDVDGRISRPVLYGSIALAVVVMAVSVWWSFVK